MCRCIRRGETAGQGGGRGAGQGGVTPQGGHSMLLYSARRAPTACYIRNKGWKRERDLRPTSVVIRRAAHGESHGQRGQSPHQPTHHITHAGPAGSRQTGQTPILLYRAYRALPGCLPLGECDVSIAKSVLPTLQKTAEVSKDFRGWDLNPRTLY